MRTGVLVLVAWSALLALHTCVLILMGGGELPVLLLGGAAAAVALLAAVIAARRRLRRRTAEELQAVPDLSPPSALAALAVAGLVVGAELGTWLVLISAGLLVVAIAGLWRELRRQPTTIGGASRRASGPRRGMP